jgi:hypothetical protein
MKPLLTLKDHHKETYFNLQVYDLIEKIETRCSKWLNGVFMEVYVPESIETSNLCMDLDYFFTQAIWLIELAESFGYNLESKEFIERMYDDYTSSDEGYKNLIDYTAYNIKEY